MSRQPGGISLKVTFLGGGQMTEALIGGLVAGDPDAALRLMATDPVSERRDLLKRRFGVQTNTQNREAAAWADIVVLAVKPQVFDGVLREVAEEVRDKLVISIAAGVPISRISRILGTADRIVRVMPNAPALVREGLSALAWGPGVSDSDQAFARRLLESVGKVAVVEERLMDAVTGLSGSGPAFVFVIIEALADGGVKAGLPRSVAEQLAAQTVLGAARMVLQTGRHPAQLKDWVASPGGTTIAGLHQLELGRVRAALIAAVEAAAQRSEELGKTCS